MKIRDKNNYFFDATETVLFQRFQEKLHKQKLTEVETRIALKYNKYGKFPGATFATGFFDPLNASVVLI